MDKGDKCVWIFGRDTAWLNNRENVYVWIPNWMMFFNETDVFRFDYDSIFTNKKIVIQIAFANENNDSDSLYNG